MATMQIPNFAGGAETVEKPLAPGRAAAASARPIAFSTEDLAAINAITAGIGAPADAADTPDPIAGTASVSASLVAMFKALFTLGIRTISVDPATGAPVPYNNVIDTNEIWTTLTGLTAGHTNYTNGKGIGPKQTLTNVARVDGGSGEIVRFSLRSVTQPTVPTFAHLFRDDPTLSSFTNTGTVSLNAADRLKRLKTFKILPSSWAQSGGVSTEWEVELIGPAGVLAYLPYKKASGRDMQWAWESGGSQGAFAATTDVSYIFAAENN